MNITISPSKIGGTVAAVPSKSDAHRKLICAAFADGESDIKLSSLSDDINATISCLRAIGADISCISDTVHIKPVVSAAADPLLDCRESGSTLRFMLTTAAAVSDSVRFTGSGRLPGRPISELLRVMSEHGVTFSGNRLPFSSVGRLKCGKYVIRGDISSQFISGLMLALPMLDGDSIIELSSPLQSAPYVDITLSALKTFGISIYRDKKGWSIPGGQRPHSPSHVKIEGDWSNSAFFLTLGAISSPVTVTGLDISSSQGDKAICDILRRFGADVRVCGDSVTVSPAPLRGCTVDAGDTPDLFPALAVAAACACGETRFINISRLRLKESDRIASVFAMLSSLGAKVCEQSDGLSVFGAPLSGGAVQSFNDHRIAMAAAAAAAVCKNPVSVIGAEAVNKSYPTFFDDYTALGGIVNVQ